MDYHYEARHYYGDTNNRPNNQNPRINPNPTKIWDINDEANFPCPIRCHRLHMEDEDVSYDNKRSYHRQSQRCDYDREDNDFDDNTPPRTQRLNLNLSRRNSTTSSTHHTYDEPRGDQCSKQQPHERQKSLKKVPSCKFCADSDGTCPCPIHLPAVRSRYMRIPVGYAYALYTLLGDLVEDPMELEPYETYVVVNNCKKKFVHMEYGSKKPTAIYMSRCRRIPRTSSTFNMVSKYPLRK
ncbi:hypothetical protein Ocin01_14566 [Orchesella cincta]|uniref:Uncharacterized protein n=1 Tax=Orchesella cincta TaxID=48709 RepID=A0A1D2MGW6_ORCCI|nr:hypothetical protein Ocin01_14566 [Orchesella cincta]